MMDDFEDLELLQIDFYNILGTPNVQGDDEEIVKGNYISKNHENFLSLQLSAMLHGFGKDFDPNRRLSFLQEHEIPARSIRIPLEDGLQLGWAPNGYGKTFVFEQLLARLSISDGMLDYVGDVKSSIESNIKTVSPFSSIGLLFKKGVTSYAVLVMAPYMDGLREKEVIDAYFSEASENHGSEEWVYSMGGAWEHFEPDDERVRKGQSQHLIEEALVLLFQHEFKYLEIPKVSSNNFTQFLQTQAKEIYPLLPDKSFLDDALSTPVNGLYEPRTYELRNHLIQQLTSNCVLPKSQEESLSMTIASFVEALFKQPTFPHLAVFSLFKGLIDLRFQRTRVNRRLIRDVLDELRVEFETRSQYPEVPEHIVYHDLAELMEIHSIYGAYADLLADNVSTGITNPSLITDFFTRFERGLKSNNLYTRYRSAILLPYLWPSISDICSQVGMSIPKSFAEKSSEDIVGEIFHFTHAMATIGDLFSQEGAMIERANEGRTEVNDFMRRLGEDAEIVKEHVERIYAFTPGDVDRGDEFRFFSGGPEPPYFSVLWPQLYPKHHLDLESFLRNLNKNLNSKNDPWGVKGEFVVQHDSSQPRFIFRPSSRPSDEIPPEILSFGMRSEITLQVVLARFLDDLSRRSRSEKSRKVLIIDESEVGRSEYWTHLLIERLNLLEREMSGRKRASIMVISHRGLVLEEARLDGEYKILHPVPHTNLDDESNFSS